MFKHGPHPDCQPTFGFYSNFSTSILVSISWYSPMVLPWMEFYTVRTRYSLRHSFKYWLSIQKEYLIFLVQITLKIDGFVCLFVVVFFFCTELYIVDTLASQRTWPILSVIRCSYITFNCVRRRIYVGGHVGLDSYWPICKVGNHLFFSFLGHPTFFFRLASNAFPDIG